MKIKAYSQPWNDRTIFLLYTNNPVSGKKYVVQPIELILKEQQEGVVVEPTFFLDSEDQYEFIKSMAELAESMGIKTDRQEKEESKNTGVLEATKYHLEDFRKLVFKKQEDEFIPELAEKIGKELFK